MSARWISLGVPMTLGVLIVAGLGLELFVYPALRIRMFGSRTR